MNFKIFKSRTTCYIFFLLIVACNNNNNKNEKTSDTNQDVDTTTGKQINLSLNNLFLTKKEFDSLIVQYNPNPYKKFVFQFLITSKDLDKTPTLALWPSKKNNQDFARVPQILHFASRSNIPLPDSIFIGTLQADVDSIKKAVDQSTNCQEKCVLYFVPSNNKYIPYKIYLVEDSTGISKSKFDINTYRLISEVNPSPPATAN